MEFFLDEINVHKSGFLQVYAWIQETTQVATDFGYSNLFYFWLQNFQNLLVISKLYKEWYSKNILKQRYNCHF